MFLFPIAWPDLNRFTGVEPFEGQSFESVLCLLISAEKAVYVGFDGETLRLGSGAESCF